MFFTFGFHLLSYMRVFHKQIKNNVNQDNQSHVSQTVAFVFDDDKHTTNSSFESRHDIDTTKFFYWNQRLNLRFQIYVSELN